MIKIKSNYPDILTPDYFLPSSQSESYYSRKYGGNHATSSIGINPIYPSKRGKISRVASVMLLSLGFLATALEVKAQPNLESAASSSSFTLQSPLQQQAHHIQQPKKKPLLTRAAHKVSKRLGFSRVERVTREPEISMEELKELYTAEYGESMDVTIERGTIGADQASGLAKALKQSLALREKTLERRRTEDIFSKEPIYSKPIDAISIASSSCTEYEEPWSDPDIEIGEAFETEFSTSKKQQRFEPSAPPLSAYSSVSSSSNRVDNRDIKLTQEELAAIEMLDQTIEDSGYSSPSISNSSNSPSISSSPTNEVGFQGGYETDISNCSSFDTSSTEYDTEAEIRSYENVPLQSRSKKLRTRKARNASSAGEGARYSYKDIEQGLASFQSDTDFSDESSDASSFSDTDGYDTVYTSSSSEYSNDSSDEDDVPLPPPPTAEELAELDNTAEPTELSAYSKVSNPDEVESAKASDVLEVPDIASRFTNQDVTKEVSVVADIKDITEDITEDIQDESTVASVLKILDEYEAEEATYEIPTKSGTIAVTELQDQQTTAEGTIASKEELLKKAGATSYISHDELRVARKVASNHIKQRMFERNMLVAVASGDESESDQSKILGYSVWSSGAFGSAKQKASNNSDGYSSKILGGSIGADVKFENELLLGASFSKIRSNIKHANQSANKKLNTYIASLYGSSSLKENLTLGVIGSAGFSPKPRSKLLSLESHLNYKIALPQNITLIPHIGFKYEYERSKTYQEQIDSNVSIAHARKSYQELSTEIGSRVIFAPIKLADSRISTISITPTAHISIERRIGGRGVNSPYHLTYQGNGGVGQEIGASTLSINPQHQKTSFNAGIGLIASHKNIKLELLYDHTRQKRFKAHQGVLKLKVSL